MQHDEARLRLQEIHRQVARTSEFGGFRPGYLALIGGAAFALALIQALQPDETAASRILLQWMLLGGVCALLVGAFVIVPELKAAERYRRELAAAVLRQFSPALIVGCAAGVYGILNASPGSAMLASLPTVFAGSFGLGIVAISPFVPARAGLISWWYIACAGLLLWFQPDTSEVIALSMGVTFGAGHTATALLLRAR